jgi:hypothetical protein
LTFKTKSIKKKKHKQIKNHMENFKKKFNDENAGLILSLQQTKKRNQTIIEEYNKQLKNSIILIVGIAMIFIAIHDFNRWPLWSTYFAAIVVSGFIAGGITYAYWYWKKPKTMEPERVKLNELAKEFLTKESLPAVTKKLTNDGYDLYYSPDTDSLGALLNDEAFIKPDGTIIDGQILNNGKSLFLTKNGIKFVLSKWSFNDNGIDIEAKIVSGAVQI